MAAADDATTQVTGPGGAPVKPGDVLAGKYEVERVLGAGGMGVVVAAKHLELDQRVAVKFLLPEAVESQEAAARFVREARAAVKIKSEHVARVIDVGRLETGAPYMVMEYLEGRDLAQRVREGPLSIEDAVDFVIQAADAMAEAHSIGIIHRDLKPANLFLSERSDGSHVVKVLDFGISKVALPELTDAALTRTSTAMGSPLYMSPEQMRSAKDVDARTDIWALGTILYELLSGATPFRALTYPDLCAKIMAESPEPLRQLRPDVPEALEAVVARCLEKDPTRRYANVAELAHALAPFAPKRSRAVIERVARVLSRAGISSSSLDLPVSMAEPTAAATAPEAGTKTSWGDTKAPSPKRSLALGLAAVGLLLVAAVGITLVLSKSGSEPELAAPSAMAESEIEPAVTVAEPEPQREPEPEPPASASAAPPPPEPSASAPPVTKVPALVKPSAPKPKPAASTAAPDKTAPPPAPAPAPAPTKKPDKNPLDISIK